MSTLAECKQRYVDTVARTGYGSITLRRISDHAVIEFEESPGQWKPVSRARLDCKLSAAIIPPRPGYGPVILSVDGRWVTVQVRHAVTREWATVIREHRDSNFSHCVTAFGIHAVMFGSGC